MTHHDDIRPAPLTHEACQELLPWLLNRTLEETERQAVDRHLSACSSCRSDLESLERVRGAVREPEPDDAAGGDLPEILSRIDAMRRYRRGTSGLVRWALIGQAAAIVILAVTLLVSKTGSVADTSPLYRTLSATPQFDTRTGSLRVVFDETTTERELREVLRSVDARIVDGPSSVGAYTILVAGDDNLASVVDRLRSEVAVRLAEPVASRD